MPDTGKLLLINDIVEGVIHDLSSKGHGVLKHSSGINLFIPGAWPGDKGFFKITKLEKRYGFAKVKTITQNSPDRIEVPCRHQGENIGQCGGCPWMIAKYDSQLHYKKKRLLYSLEKRNFNLAEIKINDVIPSPQIFGYRNRAQLKTDGIKLGFVSSNSKELVSIKDCPVLSPKNRETLSKLHSILPNKDFAPKKGSKYLWNLIDIDEEIDIDSIKPNKRLPFKQANSLQNEKMKEWIQTVTKSFDKGQTFLELFCGSGNFTKTLVKNGFNHIIAMDFESESIEKLKKENLSQVEIIKKNLFKKDIWNSFPPKHPIRKCQYLLLDPPREGLKVKDNFFKIFPDLKEVVYISCNIDTFAQDARFLSDHGMVLDEVTPIDQFPHTPHLEIMSRLKLGR